MSGLSITVPAALALFGAVAAGVVYLTDRDPAVHIHGAERRGDPERCAGLYGCGHRLPVDGVEPLQTRTIALRDPMFAFTEIYGRIEARRPLPRRPLKVTVPATVASIDGVTDPWQSSDTGLMRAITTKDSH